MFSATFRKMFLQITIGWLGWCIANVVIASTFIPYGKPNLDGDLSEWQKSGHGYIRMARFYGPSKSAEGDSDQFADLWLMWDNDYLYIAGRLDDLTPTENNPPGVNCKTWDDDSLEIYLHPSLKAPAQLDQYTRILAFTPTGKCQRLDRGCKKGECPDTTGLEDFGNTTAKIKDDRRPQIFNTPLGRDWACPDKPSSQTATIHFKPSQTARDWQFEAALPWELVGTQEVDKIVGANCAVGKGLIPTKFTPKEGMALRLNFYRINDDGQGEVKPASGEMIDGLGNKQSNGIMQDEWFVYQGERYHPNEWATFILGESAKACNDRPKFAEKLRAESLADGRRVRLKFKAPSRGTSGDALALPAYRYEIRYLEGGGAINDSSWDKATPFVNAYIPLAPNPNTEQALDIIGLNPGKDYTVAIRAITEISCRSDILSATVKTAKEDHPFVTVSPTGRTLVLSDGKPFVPVGETGLMPWLPLRGLYDGELCDENAGGIAALSNAKPCSGTNKDGDPINNGRLRNYNTEKIFYHCRYDKLPAGCTSEGGCQIALSPGDIIPDDNCRDKYGSLPKETASVEGAGVAEYYFAQLKANGVNVVTTFVESLDLDVTPIFLQIAPGQPNEAVLRYLDRLIDLAKKNEVYLLLRLYDTFYYKDNGYNKGSGRKWADTYWSKMPGKQSPDNFFDGDLHQLHIDRMKVLLERYRNEPHILGWDLLNEIDNQLRFNAADYDKRRKWVERMVQEAKRIDPNHLIFYSFLAWDPKDSVHYRNKPANIEKYLGIDATFAYRLPGVDMAVPHGYYAHVANPWESAPADYTPAMEIARGITYGFHQIYDGRPILDGESSPNPHLYKKGYGDNGFDQKRDEFNFVNSIWTHFAAGGAGAGLQWPADLVKVETNQRRHTINQIPPTKRKFFKIFQNNVGDIPWRGDLLQIFHRKAQKDVVQITRQDSKNAVVFLYNPNKNAIQNITLADLPTGKASIKVIIPSSDEVVFDEKNNVDVGQGKTISLKRAVNESVAVIVRNIVIPTSQQPLTPPPTTQSCQINQGTGGFCASEDIWIKALIHLEDAAGKQTGKTIEAQWVKGEEAKSPRGDRVIWGYLYASPIDIGWGNKDNPDVFVKIWYDTSGRVDVNFFHVSVPEIEISSAMKGISVTGCCSNRITTAQRYLRHEYSPAAKTAKAELQKTLEVLASAPTVNPPHSKLTIHNLQIGSRILTEDKGAINGIWRFGGKGETPLKQQVLWGFFYADPKDVSWGFKENPEVYVKIWYEPADKKLYANFFHVSAPNIEVYSGFSDERYEEISQVTQGERYTRHEYSR